MTGLLTMIMRRSRLKRHGSDIRTGLIPVSGLKSAGILIDTSDPSCTACAEDASKYFKSKSIDTAVYFLDLRKYRKKEIPPTDRPTTITRKDLNWFGKPDMVKISGLVDKDLLVSLTMSESYPAIFISKVSRAKFKIGISDYKGHPFDIMISGSGDGGQTIADKFKAIRDFLDKIQ